MEITIHDAKNFPEKATLSVRVGATRRLQACGDGPTQMRFPSLDSSSFSLDLLQPVSKPQQISLHEWKRQGCVEMVERITLPSLQVGQPAMSASLKFSLVDAQSPPPKPKRSRHQISLEAKSYLDQHGVQDLVQGLLHEVLKRHPDNPIEFMIQYLEDLRKNVQAPQPSQEGKAVANSASPECGKGRTKSMELSAQEFTKQDASVDLEALREKTRNSFVVSAVDGSLNESVHELKQTPPTTAGDPSTNIWSLPSTAEGPCNIGSLPSTAEAPCMTAGLDGVDAPVRHDAEASGTAQPQDEAQKAVDQLQEAINDLMVETLQPHCPFQDMPGLNDEDYPGFPIANCPETLPDLSKHHSIVTDILKSDPDMHTRLKDRETRNGVTWGRCIKTGIDNPGHPLIKAIGCVAGDEESYEVFNDLFDRAIDQWHGGWKADSVHSTDLDVSKLIDVNIDPDGKYVQMARVRAGRSIKGLRLPPACDRSERRECERLVTKALLGIKGDLQGDYYPLRDSWTYAPKPGGMSTEDEEDLLKDHLLFLEPDSIMTLCTGIGRHWPEARGVFASYAKNLVVWVNEEDHLRVVSMDAGSNLQQIFKRFVSIATSVDEALQKDGYCFMHNNHLGYISSSPSNLGTGLRASVILKIPLLGVQPMFKSVCKSLGLEARSAVTPGSSGGGVWDVANMKRLGISEVETINQVINGCIKLIELEQTLERQEPVAEIIACLTAAPSPKASEEAAKLPAATDEDAAKDEAARAEDKKKKQEDVRNKTRNSLKNGANTGQLQAIMAEDMAIDEAAAAETKRIIESSMKE